MTSIPTTDQDDYLDPNVHDPRRKEHFLENKHAVDQRTGVLRMTNFSLGSDPTKPATTYASNFVEPQSGEKHTIVKKPVDTPDHADRIIAKYADVGPRSTVYQDTFKQLSTEGSAGTVPRHRPQDAPDNIHFYNAGHTAMLKESVSRAAYCPPEMMVDRTERH